MVVGNLFGGADFGAIKDGTELADYDTKYSRLQSTWSTTSLGMAVHSGTIVTLVESATLPTLKYCKPIAQNLHKESLSKEKVNMTIVFNNPYGSPSRELPIDDTVVVDIDSRREQVLAATETDARNPDDNRYGRYAAAWTSLWASSRDTGTYDGCRQSKLNDMEDADFD